MVVAIGKDGHSTCPDHGPKASVDQRRGSLPESGAAVQLAAWVESVEWRRRRLPEVLRKLVDSVGVCLPIPLGPHRFVTPVGVRERAQKREPSPGGRRQKELGVTALEALGRGARREGQWPHGFSLASTRECVEARRLLGRRKTGLTTAVSDVHHSNNIPLNGEQDSIEVRLPPVQELPHFEVKLAILQGERTTRGELR